MHRVDLARATGRPMELDDTHDARIVADVAREPHRLDASAPGEGLLAQAVPF